MSQSSKDLSSDLFIGIIRHNEDLSSPHKHNQNWNDSSRDLLHWHWSHPDFSKTVDVDHLLV